ncbi:MAG TPA: phage tail sheath C-terminal domain-containing protein [Longimicrobiales bacterium]|nr:phage tail sheath C-terminal domain-containing protein [Longimicrobiales bacterium]
MPTYKTPDVYIEEIPVFPPSVAEVETAVPAFIGYTEQAKRIVDDDLILRPMEIQSLKEYEQWFGGPRREEMAITIENDGGVLKTTSFQVNTTEVDDSFVLPYLLYYAVQHYFNNGGGKCYIVSVGTYQAVPVIDLAGGDEDDEPATRHGLQDGLDAIELEDEPTLLVFPEAVNLNEADYSALVQAALTQCGELKDRFCIFDVYHGNVNLRLPPEGETDTAMEVDRAHFGDNNLKYGAAYYPFLRTTYSYLLQDSDGEGITVTAPDVAGLALSTLVTTNTELYNFVKEEIKQRYIVLPPSAAVAGVYAATDTNRGVWKAPANVSLANVIEPLIKLNNLGQAPLNVDPTTGKSINAIRSFAGRGSIVWGARTLAGNDNEWRYVSVRRFFNMVEESTKKSTYWAVFEPNDANTWVKVRGMIENYLTQKWREGALAGATPRDAFFVRCGLGTTMSAQDILEGRLNVEIGMAVVRPAEFIILKFFHKLQTS